MYLRSTYIVSTRVLSNVLKPMPASDPCFESIQLKTKCYSIFQLHT